MGEASAVIRVPRSVVRRLAREAERLGMSLEEYILDLLLRDADPPERAREYAEAAGHLIDEAREELARGNVRQAAEKLWGAAALAVKAYAAWRDGRRLASHGELWEYSRILAEELGDWVHDSWMSATGMHVCFHEGWCTRAHVEQALRRVARLVEEVYSRVLSSRRGE